MLSYFPPMSGIWEERKKGKRKRRKEKVMDF